MFEFAKRFFRGGGTPPGITMADDQVRKCGELIRRCVVAQFNEAGLPLMTAASPYRSLVLGYVATLAEEIGTRLSRDEGQGVSMLICFIAMEGVDAAPEHEDLMREFTELTDAREYMFGQGGAIALEDFPGLAKQIPPRGLALELMRMRAQ